MMGLMIDGWSGIFATNIVVAFATFSEFLSDES